MDEAVADALCKTLPAQTMGIADLGCSSGPNTLMVVSEMISKIYDACSQMGISLPELRVSLNDLPGNDFNYIFMSLPEFYCNLEKETGVGLDGCFISGVAGSFYGRLFPRNSLHLVYSSSSLHWLSQVPPGLCTKAGKHLNKGKIYISKTSPPSVVKAYLSQFQKDFFAFLRSRAAEMVAGGRMLLSFMGRSSPDAAAEVGTHQWELLAQALMSMALERQRQRYNVMLENLSRGGQVAKTVRAVVETMLESQFGRDIMDELFRRYAELVDRYFSKTRAKHINLVLSVSRNTINSCY
ncbi:UNVERIFIED_CONTAM: Jasmonate O-methyltransferase [Sesamum radiatum]|uniref:Jasmonate O-methyltransferase n=1 Tax=Sesamum radiatum TaxID=300843 RepID=A0AAW2M5K1_SESRA